MRRGSLCAALAAAGCAQTETLEPSTSSVVRGDASVSDASSCGTGPCSGSGGAHSTGGAGGIVQTGGMPQSGGMPSVGGRVNTGGQAAGGANTGGTSTGGAATGGTSTGGVATGGTSTGGAATGGGSACPNYPTNDDCSRCICSRCATQVSSCLSSSDTTKNQQCKQIQDCAQQNHCASTPCYCGPNDALCLTADGPCVSVIRTVVGSSNLTDVISATNDTNHPLGRANQIGVCSTNNCRSECGL